MCISECDKARACAHELSHNNLQSQIPAGAAELLAQAKEHS